MNLRQLETFYWAARLGGFSKAAQKLNATQSAVSMRIQEVENRLGATMFDRSQRSARLTPEGARLLPYAEEVLFAHQRLMEAAAPDNQQVAGYVRLGATENVAVTWLGTLIKALKSEFPLIQIELEVGISYLLEEKLNAGSLDMALAACELPPSKFHSIPLQSIDFRWMCSPNLSDIPNTVTPETLTELPILSVTREWQASGSHLKWLTDNRIHYRNVTICNTFRTTAAMAIEGLGLAQLPLRLFQEEIRQGKLKILQSEPEIPPLQILAIRPAADNSPVYQAIEIAARKAAAAY